MVKFTYLPDDRIAQITDVFSSFNEPQNPIPAEITDLTGITDEMVLGHRIDPDAVAAFACRRRDCHRAQRQVLTAICRALLAPIRTEGMGLLGNGGGMAQTWI